MIPDPFETPPRREGNPAVGCLFVLIAGLVGLGIIGVALWAVIRIVLHFT